MARGRMLEKVIILSKKINSVSEGAENLYYRLLVYVDDYGRYHADPEIIKGQLYPKRKISIRLIEKRLEELWNIGLIKLYEDDDEIFFEITEFEKHQKFRVDIKRKADYPEPKKFLQRSCNEPGTGRDGPGAERCSNIIKSISIDNLIKPIAIDNKREKSTSLCLKKISDEDRRLTQLLIDLILKNDPKSSIIKRLSEKRQLEWLDACRKLREIDGRSPDEIESIIKFSQQDAFWKSNILSMPKLREKFDQLFLKAKKEKYSGIREWLSEMEKKNDTK